MKEDKKLDIWWIILLITLALTILTFLFATLFYSLLLFIILYLPIIIYILIYKWIKRWFAAGVFSFSIWLNIVILFIPIVGGYLALDISNFYQDIKNKPSYIAINDNGLIFAGRLDLIQGAFQNGETKELILSKSELANLQKEINNNIKGKTVFVLDKKVFRIVDKITVSEFEISLTTNQVLETIKSDDPIKHLTSQLDLPELLADIINEEIKDSKTITPENIKGILVVLLLQETIKKGGTEYLIEELKDGNIKIYPERLSVSLLIKFIPSDIISGSGLVPNVLTTSETVANKVVNKR